MANVPTVSICLPVYNGEAYLAEAIEAALSQTYGDFEFLIGDDCSSDSSESIVQKYASQDKRIIYWKNSVNKGLFGNYNECMNRAQGKYIKPYAQDDIFEPALLEHEVAAFAKYPEIALVACARKIVDDDGREIKVRKEYHQDTLLNGDDKIEADLLKLSNGIGEPSTVLFPRQLVGTGFDITLHHLGDIEYWHRLIRGKAMFYSSETLCKFRRHSQSTSNRNARGLRFGLDMLRIKDKYKDFLESRGVSESAYAQLCMLAISTHTRFLAQHENLKLSDLIAERGDTKESLIADLAGFKELTFRALLIAAEAYEEAVSLKSEWQAEREKLENDIAKLMESRSWKVTVPLREAVKAAHAVKRGLR